jgi:hypothetical protein
MTVFTGRDLTENSNAGGVVCVVMPAASAATEASSQPCRSCLVSQKTGTQVYMQLYADPTSATMATSTDWKLSTIPIPVPVTDIADMHFIGTENDVVQIMWRN